TRPCSASLGAVPCRRPLPCYSNSASSAASWIRWAVGRTGFQVRLWGWSVAGRGVGRSVRRRRGGMVASGRGPVADRRGACWVR
ncbi:Hypothetical protein SCLAV_5475, partial [Streptomyces clavuligerus]